LHPETVELNSRLKSKKPVCLTYHIHNLVNETEGKREKNNKIMRENQKNN